MVEINRGLNNIFKQTGFSPNRKLSEDIYREYFEGHSLMRSNPGIVRVYDRDLQFKNETCAEGAVKLPNWAQMSSKLQ